MNGKIALRGLLTGNKNSAMRILDTLAHDIKCKWENQLKESELSLVRGTN
jgi:hypothetical protein